MNSKLISRLRKFDSDLIRCEYLAGDPFPHVIIDNFFEPDFYAHLESCTRSLVSDNDTSNSYLQKNKVSVTDWEKFDDFSLAAMYFFSSGPFISFLEHITDIPSLLFDPSLEGAGIHKTARGGFLKMHTDFNWHKHIHLHRRLNVLFYLNSGYQACWGGGLNLCLNPEKTSIDEMRTIEPVANRLVIFNTNDTTFHGHPTPHLFPENFPRTSIALYYYTAKPRPLRESRRLTTFSTRYVPHKGDEINISESSGSRRNRIGYLLRRYIPFL